MLTMTTTIKNLPSFLGIPCVCFGVAFILPEHLSWYPDSRNLINMLCLYKHNLSHALRFRFPATLPYTSQTFWTESLYEYPVEFLQPHHTTRVFSAYSSSILIFRGRNYERGYVEELLLLRGYSLSRWQAFHCKLDCTHYPSPSHSLTTHWK